MVNLIVKVQNEDFDVQKEIQFLKKSCKEIPGAINSFVGYVRDFSNNEKITSLTIEHYEGMTENKLYEISKKACRRWPLLGTLIIHRFGNLDTGDQIVLAASASLHRKAAFESTAFMMDYLKTSAPFWKSENLKNKKIWVDTKLDDELAAKKWSE